MSGARLNGANRYTVTFAKDQTPPVNGFWSLTLYNEHHFFAPNEIKRYSIGTKNKDAEIQSRTARSRSMCRPTRRQPRSATTGCPRRRATSRSTSAPTGRRLRSWMDWTPPAVQRVSQADEAASLALNGQWKASLLQV